MWGPLPPAVPRTLELLCVLKVLGKVKQRAKFQHRISVHHAVMRICISHRLTIICAQKLGFSGFWGWRCENIVIWPPKGTTLREYVSADVSHVKIGSTTWASGRLEILRTNKKKNWVATLAIWGEVTPGATLTICGVWGDMVDLITCAMFGDCRLRDVGVVRGANSPSPTDLMRRPYNTGHTTVWLTILERKICAKYRWYDKLQLINLS